MKLLQSNWRELLAVILIVAALLVTLLLLQSRTIAEDGTASTAVSVLVTLVGGAAKFVSCLALAWFGLAVTFPEANRFVVGREFDNWWARLAPSGKAYVALAGVSVLALVAAVCIAS